MFWVAVSVARSGLVGTPMVRMPSGSAASASFRISCVAMSTLHGMTARMLLLC